MLRTLHGKLSLVLLGLLGLLGLSYIPLCLFTMQGYIQEVHQRLNRDLARHLAEDRILLQNGRVHKAASTDIKNLMTINPTIDIYLLDLQGRILAYSAPPGKVKRQRVALGPVRRFLRPQARLPILGDDPGNPVGQKVFSAAALPPQGPPRGYVYVILGGKEYDTVAQILQKSYVVRLSLGITAGSLLFVLAAGFLLFQLLTRRLRKLTRGMEEFQQQRFVPPAPFAPPHPGVLRDEIDRMGMVFAQMSERIGQQILERERADTLRRELVSNVSHDLRTPLAALQGYLETLLMKEGDLTPDEQRSYLTTALRHNERLGKMVAELFELAKLDSHEAQAHVEPFSLGELAQDVVQKFQLAAQNKGTRLEARFAADLPFVCADIGMIERVLENLIENAIRYTPEGGRVGVALTPEGGKIRVQVSDTGQGIAPDDLPHIFDRMYRGEKHRPKKDGTGLGLAITKRILEIHGSAIQVESVPSQNTIFTFHLPVCPSDA